MGGFTRLPQIIALGHCQLALFCFAPAASEWASDHVSCSYLTTKDDEQMNLFWFFFSTNPLLGCGFWEVAIYPLVFNFSSSFSIFLCHYDWSSKSIIIGASLLYMLSVLYMGPGFCAHNRRGQIHISLLSLLGGRQEFLISCTFLGLINHGLDNYILGGVRSGYHAVRTSQAQLLLLTV